jgi:hypothetical protein
MKKFLVLFSLLLLLLPGEARAVALGDLLSNARQTFYDFNGLPLVGGKVYLYVAGTTNVKASWVDINRTTLNTNPIILDALGSASIFGIGQYRQIVYDVDGNLIWDAVTSAGTNGTFGIDVPAEFTRTPATQQLNGVITIGKAAENPGTVWAGPVSGVAAPPTFRKLTPTDTGTRPILAFPTTFYVCQNIAPPCTTPGSDAAGTTGDLAHPFLTLQNAFNVVQDFDLDCNKVTIQLGTGFFAGLLARGPMVGLCDVGALHILGNETVHTNTVILGSNSNAITALDGAQLYVSGVTFQATGTGPGQGRCLAAQPTGTKIAFAYVDFDFCAVAQIEAQDGVVTSPTSIATNYRITAGSPYHAHAILNGYIDLTNTTVQFVGVPAFVVFAAADSGGVFNTAANGYIGTATGYNCSARLNGIINTETGTPQTYLPGNTGTCPATLGGQVN